VTPRQKPVATRSGGEGSGEDALFKDVSNELSDKGFLVAAADDDRPGRVRAR